MSRYLSDELAETLCERAASVPDVPSLAGASLARGRALRRRRRIATALAPAVTVVALVTAATSITGGGDRAEGPPGPAATPTDGTDLPWPRQWPRVETASGGRRVIVVAGSDRTVTLPPGADVNRLRRVGFGAVAEVRGPEGRGVVSVDEDGRARTLPGVLPPVAVTYDGALLAGTATGGADGTDGRRMVVVRLPDGDPVASLGGDRVPLAFTGDDGRDVLYADGGRLGVWHVSRGSRTEVPGVRYGEDAVLAAAPGGQQVAIADERGLRVVDQDGKTLWTRAGDRRDAATVRWSPEGLLIAAVEGRRVVVMSAVDGVTRARTAALPFDPAGVTWQDSGYVLALERDAGGRERQRLTCEIQSGTCEPYLRRDAVLPE